MKKQKNDREQRELKKQDIVIVGIFLLILAILFCWPSSAQAQEDRPFVDDPTWVVTNGEFWYTFELSGFDPLTMLSATINAHGSVVGTTDGQGNFRWTTRLSDGPSTILIWGSDKSLNLNVYVRPDGSLRNYWVAGKVEPAKDFSSARNGNGGINFYRYCQLLNGGQVGFIRSQADSWDCDDVLQDLNKVCRDIYGQGYRVNIGDPNDAYTVSCQPSLPQPPAIQFVEDDGTCAGLESFQRVNALAVVNDADSLTMTLRDHPSRDAGVVARVDPKTTLLITAGPICAESAIWWRATVYNDVSTIKLVWFAEVTNYGYNVKPWGIETPFYGEETMLATLQCQLPSTVDQITDLPTAGFLTPPRCDMPVVETRSAMLNVRAAPTMDGTVEAKAPMGAFFPVVTASWDGDRWWMMVLYKVEDQIETGWLSCGSKQDLLSHCPANPPM